MSLSGRSEAIPRAVARARRRPCRRVRGTGTGSGPGFTWAPHGGLGGTAASFMVPNRELAAEQILPVVLGGDTNGETASCGELR